MSTLRTFEKTPAERRYITVRGTKWLTDGEAFDQIAWTIESDTDTGLALLVENTQNDASACTIWLRDGLVGHEYTVTVQITTNATPVPRTRTKSFVVRVIPRR